MFGKKDKFLEEMVSSLGKDMEDLTAEINVIKNEIGKIEQRLENLERRRFEETKRISRKRK